METGWLVFLLILPLAALLQAICSYYAQHRPVLAYVPGMLFLLLMGGSFWALSHWQGAHILLPVFLALIFALSALLSFSLMVFFKRRRQRLAGK